MACHLSFGKTVSTRDEKLRRMRVGKTKAHIVVSYFSCNGHKSTNPQFETQWRYTHHNATTNHVIVVRYSYILNTKVNLNYIILNSVLQFPVRWAYPFITT